MVPNGNGCYFCPRYGVNATCIDPPRQSIKTGNYHFARQPQKAVGATPFQPLVRAFGSVLHHAMGVFTITGIRGGRGNLTIPGFGNLIGLVSGKWAWTPSFFAGDVGSPPFPPPSHQGQLKLAGLYCLKRSQFLNQGSLAAHLPHQEETIQNWVKRCLAM